MKDLDLEAIGVPSEQTYLSRYNAKTPSAVQLQPFHCAFALFQLAVIFEGIAARARSGAAIS